jgi:hypothetical protein
MDAPSLARELDNLEKSWSALDFELNIWTFLVVFGVALELIVVIREYLHDWKGFKQGTIHSPERPDIVLFIIGFLGAALVAFGVAGELRDHVRAGKIESEMRSISRELLGIAEREAGDANGKAAQLSKDAEGLKKQAEDEKLARVELQKLVSWRTIPEEKQREIGVRLKRFKGIRIGFTVNQGDSEGLAFASQIAGIALNAGWSIVSFVPLLDLGHFRTGVRLTTTGDVNTRDASDALTRELNSVGFAATRSSEIDPRQTDPLKRPLMYVEVGLRPQAIPNAVSKAIASQP